MGLGGTRGPALMPALLGPPSPTFLTASRGQPRTELHFQKTLASKLLSYHFNVYLKYKEEVLPTAAPLFVGIDLDVFDYLFK